MEHGIRLTNEQNNSCPPFYPNNLKLQKSIKNIIRLLPQEDTYSSS